MTDTSFKTSAVALQNRGLASVSRRGGWHAFPTPAGHHYLEHGSYPGTLQPKRSPSRTPRAVAPAHSKLSEEATPVDTEQSTPPEESSPVAAIPEIPARAIHVPSRVSKLHPVVAEARDNGRVPVSKNVLSRAVRIAHALALACEREGWTVQSRDKSVTRWGHAWNDSAVFVVNTGEYSQGLNIYEENDRSDHVLTSYEQREKERYGYSYAPKYDYKASGRLLIEIESHYRGRRQKWADRQRWTIEEKLRQVIDEIEARNVLEHADRLERERKEAERQQRLEAAVAEATAQFHESHRRQVFLKQAEEWHSANRIREYLEAMKDRVERVRDQDNRAQAEAWLRWCEACMLALDPLEAKIATPEDPAPSDEELRPFMPDWMRRGW